MKKQEIAYMMQNGFTMAEIMALDSPAQNPAPADSPQDPAPADPPQDPAPADPPQDPAPADNSGAVLQAIENLTKVIQAGNIRAGGFLPPDGGTNAETILANIINPPGYTGKKE